ncbi:MAG: hypothetical protein JWN33_132 [Candidatus Saccharibacteria bacterium]|nr:hypothetical protein [Candidatus Saccharibacteria bacterium]
MSIEYDRTALLALPGIRDGNPEEKGLLSWSRPYLVNEIRQHGVDVAVARGLASLDETEAMAHDVIRPVYGDHDRQVTIERLGSVGVGEFSVVRNILRPLHMETDTPLLNPNNVRALARDKYQVAQTVFGPNDMYGREATLIDREDSGSDVQAKLESLPGDLVVAKPINGQRSKGVYVGTKEEVSQALTERTAGYIVEEKLDFSSPLPHLRGVDAEQQSRLEHANQEGVNKEVRLYYFGNDQWDVVGRVAKRGEIDFRSDEWLYLDLESTPGYLVEGARQVIARLQEITGSDEFNIAIDWVYASSASRPEPEWKPMELNAAEPQLVQLGEHDEIGRRHHRKLAEQISRIALNRYN